MTRPFNGLGLNVAADSFWEWFSYNPTVRIEAGGHGVETSFYAFIAGIIGLLIVVVFAWENVRDIRSSRTDSAPNRDDRLHALDDSDMPGPRLVRKIKEAISGAEAPIDDNSAERAKQVDALTESLLRLAALRDRGILSHEEFEMEKKIILKTRNGS